MSRDLESIPDSDFDSDAGLGFESLLDQEKDCWKEVATTTTTVVEGQDRQKGRMDFWARATRHDCEMDCSKIG